MTRFTIAFSDITIDADKHDLSTYEFGTRVAKHYFCNKCGIYTFHQSMSKPGQYRFNIGCFENINSMELPFEVFDGAAI